MTFNKNINFLLLVPLCVLVIFCRIVNFFRIKKERNKIILLIDLGHFGDALMLTPSIKYLRNHDLSKSYKIFCITTVLGKKALDNNPDIDAVYTVSENWDHNYSNKNWLKNYKDIYSIINSINPEVAISCRSTAYHIETIAMFNALVSRRIGFSSKGLKNTLTDTLHYDNRVHRANQNIDLIKLFTKDKEKDISTIPYFYPDVNNINKSKFDEIFNIDKKIVLINIFAEHKYIWPIDFYKEIIEFLISEQYYVCFVGLEKYREKIDSFLINKNYHSVFNLSGETTIDDLSYILKKSDLLITIDTGVRHLANCYTLKVISFRKTPNLDSEFGQYVNSEIVLNEKINREKYSNVKDFVNILEPKIVIDQIKKLEI